jgi:hypothetical protein
MDRQRTRDRLTGAALAVLLLGVVLAGLLWWLTEPAGTAPPPSGGPPAAAPGGLQPPGDLAADESWLADVVLDAGEVITPDSQLRDVRAVGRDVRSGPTGARAGTLEVDATVPFEVVARELGSGIVVRRAGSRAQVVRTVVVAGRELRVVATGDVTVVDGRLVVEPRSIDIGGPDLLASRLADVARRLVTIEQEVEGLPRGWCCSASPCRTTGSGPARGRGRPAAALAGDPALSGAAVAVQLSCGRAAGLAGLVRPGPQRAEQLHRLQVRCADGRQEAQLLALELRTELEAAPRLPRTERGSGEQLEPAGLRAGAEQHPAAAARAVRQHRRTRSATAPTARTRTARRC